MKKWSVIIVLALGQFVMILDATVMNVSLSTVKADLLKNALQTGLLIMPMSVGVILFAMAGQRLASRFSAPASASSSRSSAT